MSGTNDYVTFSVPNLAERSISDLPKGDLLSFGVNPYNGNVVIRFQNNERGFNTADEILDYISETLYQMSLVKEKDQGFKDFVNWANSGCDSAELGHFALCPTCKTEPYFNAETHELICECPGNHYRFFNQEQALEVWNYTRNYREVA